MLPSATMERDEKLLLSHRHRSRMWPLLVFVLALGCCSVIMYAISLNAVTAEPPSFGSFEHRQHSTGVLDKNSTHNSTELKTKSPRNDRNNNPTEATEDKKDSNHSALASTEQKPELIKSLDVNDKAKNDRVSKGTTTTTTTTTAPTLEKGGRQGTPRTNIRNFNTGPRAGSGECFTCIDYGLIDSLRAVAKPYCTLSSEKKNSSKHFQSSYTHYRFDRANMESTVFHGLRLDLSNATVAHDIANVSQDGARHDPRLKFDSVRPLCACATGLSVQDSQHGAPRIWRSRMAEDKYLRPGTALRRPARESDKMFQACNIPTAADVPSYTFREDVRVLLIARKDDHNPFFQFSTTFNTWIMMKALEWSNLDTQIVYLDKGIPSAVDELRRGLLAPSQPSLTLAELAFLQPSRNQHAGVIEFGTVLIAPFEDMGPMMRHLENTEPCRRSQLMIDFRSESLASMGVKDEKNSGKCTLTIISRRNYKGRNLQRIWHNEQEVLDRMIADFGDRCTMQAVDFVGVPMAEQMRTIVNSDIVVGMHGAGMANVMWTRPETLVIEIFPKPRRRWGFRNICQHVGCDWHDFRGGQDIPSKTSKPKNGRPDPNALDKSIPPNEWAAFANPLLEVAISRALRS